MKASSDFVARLEHEDWADGELEQASLGDSRLDQRLRVMVSDFAEHPGAPIPEACGTKAKTNGAYGFIENDSIAPAAVLQGHHRATLDRLAQEAVILAPSDTTSFNYTRLHATSGLSAIGPKAPSGERGLWLHSTHAFTPSGLPLGLLAAWFWNRPLVKTDLRDHHAKPFAERESFRWWESWQACQRLRAQLPPATLLVNITDMEGDMYEVFAAALAQEGPRAELLIRSRHNRKLEEADAAEQRLWEHLAQQPLAATLEVRVPRHEKQPARLATLQIRFCEVELAAPTRKTDQPPLHLWGVEARELHPPTGVEPILWRLLTTLPVTTAEAAIQKVRWYAVRWSIETFHKIIKSVCQVEAKQMETAERLERMILVNAVVAWRIQILTQVGRQYPNLPASDYFTQSEWQALHSHLYPQEPVLTQAPGLGQLMHWVGQLGGFVRCKSNPHPGPITLARGLARLKDIAMGWELYERRHAKCK
ncbi:MAG TPA: IS4 family transposase [Candidatus Sulfotelmatobacter sp.]|nr:IS4 family transposase [Candidatus Sulfotelmatobacter sp.]